MIRNIQKPGLTRTVSLNRWVLSFVVGMLTLSTHAAIVVSNSGASSVFASMDGNDSGSFLYNNTTDFLAVTINLSGDNTTGITGTVPAPVVTYNGIALTEVRSDQRTNRNWSSIFYLANPDVGNHTLSVDFGANVVPVGAGGFMFGALSLSNVDKSNPVLTHNGVTANGGIPYTITGDMSPGDFLLTSNTADNTTNGDGNVWMIIQETGNSDFFYWAKDPNSPRHYTNSYWTLTSADITNGNELTLVETGQNRPKASSGVVFAAIPEPGTLALTLVALVGFLCMGARRRR